MGSKILEKSPPPPESNYTVPGIYSLLSLKYLLLSLKYASKGSVKKDCKIIILIAENARILNICSRSLPFRPISEIQIPFLLPKKA